MHFEAAALHARYDQHLDLPILTMQNLESAGDAGVAHQRVTSKLVLRGEHELQDKSYPKSRSAWALYLMYHVDRAEYGSHGPHVLREGA